MLASLGERIDEIAIPARQNRLAFLKNLDDTNIWKIQLKTVDSLAAGQSMKIIASSRFDQRPAISPDGSQIAFESNRDGYSEIWLIKAATGETRRLTDLKPLAGSPRWSPDGRWIVFDGRVKSSSCLFRTSVLGGAAQRLTPIEGSADTLPVYSPDGQWIYFTSNRSGRHQIWRMPAAGGMATLETEGLGTAPEVSPDNRFLYYLEKVWDPSHLWRKDLRTGDVTLVANQILFRGYAVGKNAIYALRDGRPNIQLLALSQDGKQSRVVALLSTSIVSGISLSPNEDALYYAQFDNSGHELMLVNHFQ
jgi:Tol biopolymer transport system component